MTESIKRIKDKVYREFIDILFDHFHFLLYGESLGAIIFVYLLWGEIKTPLLLFWLLSVLLINGGMRHLLTYLYYKNKREEVDIDIYYWRSRFIAAAFISGLLWASSAYFFLLVNTDLYRLIVVLILLAVIGAANAVFIPDKLSYIAFTMPIFIGIITCLLTQRSSIYLILSLGILVQFLLSIKLAFYASKRILHSLAYQFKNGELLHKIIVAKKQVEAANLSLIDENEAIYKVEKELNQLATHDQLTSLPNRHLLINRLQQSIERSRRNASRTAVLFIDLDYFKEINDAHGHNIGDKLLIEASKRMLNAIRATDLLARMGGDEFCIILDNIKNISDVDTVAQKIVDVIAKPFDIQHHHLILSASIGVGLFPDDGLDSDSILKKADIALYQAKNKGRNNYLFFKDTSNTE